MATNAEYFALLSDKDQRSFEENVIKYSSLTWFLQYLHDEYKYKESFYSFIDDAFEWRNTPQGQDYWLNIANSQKELILDRNREKEKKLEDQIKSLELQVAELQKKNDLLSEELSAQMRRRTYRSLKAYPLIK